MVWALAYATLGASILGVLVALNLALYLGVLLPAVLMRSRLAWSVSVAGLCVVAFGPWMSSQWSLHPVRAELQAKETLSRVTESPGVIALDLGGLTICELVCRALFSVEGVREVQVISGTGASRYSAASAAPILANTKDLDPDLYVTFQSFAELAGLRSAPRGPAASGRVRGWEALRVVDSDGRVMGARTHLLAITPGLPAFLQPIGLFEDQEAPEALLKRETYSRLQADEIVLSLLGDVGLEFGKVAVTSAEPDLSQLRASVQSAVALQRPWSGGETRVIGAWMRILAAADTILPEDAALHAEVFARRDALLADNHADLLFRHGALRRAHLDEIVAILIRADPSWPEAYQNDFRRNVVRARVPAAEALPHRETLAAAIEASLAAPKDYETMGLIFAGRAFGLDPIPYLDRLDPFDPDLGFALNGVMSHLLAAYCSADTGEERALERFLVAGAESNLSRDPPNLSYVEIYSETLQALNLLWFSGRSGEVQELLDGAARPVDARMRARILKEPDRRGDAPASLKPGCWPRQAAIQAGP